MELKNIGIKVRLLLNKYKYCLLILLAGIILMLIPFGNDVASEATQPSVSNEPSIDASIELGEILKQIQGAGNVEVLLTLAAGEKTVYQVDEQRDSSADSESLRLETVIVSGSDRSQQGMVTQLIAPQYRGAVVVCTGADDPQVRLAVMEAVKNATGLGYDRICVLKMK